MKKNKYILKINQQFNQRKSMLYFLLILLGTIFPSISGSNYFNFWYRLYHILSSPTFNAFLYLAISLNFIYYIGDTFKNYQLINRYASYLEVVKYFLEDMIIFTIYLNSSNTKLRLQKIFRVRRSRRTFQNSKNPG